MSYEKDIEIAAKSAYLIANMTKPIIATMDIKLTIDALVEKYQRPAHVVDADIQAAIEYLGKDNISQLDVIIGTHDVEVIH